jgi:hypothetical protein
MMADDFNLKEFFIKEMGVDIAQEFSLNNWKPFPEPLFILWWHWLVSDFIIVNSFCLIFITI